MKDFYAAVQSGNRAEAWFQIRYNAQTSNPQNVNGIAKRRYEEAALFGLYNDNANITLDDAKSVYQMFTKHRDAMISYDNAHGVLLDEANKDLKAAGFTTVGALTEQQAFQDAAVKLVNEYAPGQTFDYLHIFAASIPDAQLAPNTLQIIVPTDYVNRSKDTVDDLIIGDTGTDVLTGGSGNDVLVAGKGKDTLNGGLGSNTYVITSGNGLDVIEDNKDGLGKIMLDGAQLQGTTSKPTSAGKDELTWTDGTTQYRYTPGPYNPATNTVGLICTGGLGTMTITTASNSIVVENFDLGKATDPNQGYLGIKLANFAALTADASTTLTLQQNQTTDAAHGNTKTVTIAALSGNKVQLSCDGSGSYQCSTGANLLSFANGPVDLTIPEGQDYITVTLVDTSTTPTDTATLSATVTDANGNAVTSNTLTVTFDDLNPAVNTVPPNNTTDRTITGDLQAVNFGTDANPTYKYDDLGNPITDGTPAPNQNDNLNGSAGNDLINAGGGDNTIYATQGGNDTLIAGDGYNRIFAGNGSNTITTGNGDDYIAAGSGNDRINAGNGFNVIDAQQGGNDTLHGGSGVDLISGGAGNDLITGGGEAAVAADSKYHDILSGGNGNNQIYANDQTDLATALASQKTPSTGSGQAATGQQGAFLTAGDGNNTIVGGNGNDIVFVGTGSNTVVLGAGNNTFVGGVEALSVIDWWGATGNQLWGVNATSPGSSTPANYQGNAWNAATIADQWNGVNNTITQGSASGTPFGTGNDTIFGGKGDSAYYLSNGDNWLDAGGGNDAIYAGIGHNTIFAGTGNDTIYGAGGSNYINLESGNDVMIAQGGNHTIIGGTGDDSITSGDNTIDWATSEASSTNYIYGGSGQTIIYGSGGNDTLISGSQSGSGKSTVIHAGDGNAYIVGGDGNQNDAANDATYLNSFERKTA